MKSLFFTLVATIALSIPSWATWTLVQQKAGATLTATTCALTVTSTGSGHVIIFGMAMANGNTLTGVSGGGTYTLCGVTCQQGSAGTGETDMAYTLSSTAAATTITGTASSSATGAVCFASEFSSTTTFAFDTSNKILDATCTTACASPTLTLTGANDIIMGIAGCGGTCSGAVTGYTTLYQSGDGNAVNINTASGASFSWNQTSSTLAAASLAIKETGGAATVIGMDKRRKLQKLGVL